MLRVASSFLLALTLAACGGSDGDPDLGDNADLSVVNSGDYEANAGDTLVFTAAVTNSGPAAASNVTIMHHLDGAPAVSNITCTATGSATCPAELGSSMAVERLPAGGGLVFSFTVPVPGEEGGVVTSSMIASADADEDLVNNASEASTLIHDTRSGEYIVFASNGRQYTLNIDFDSMSYEMAGPQLHKGGSMAKDLDGVSYLVGGNAKFHAAHDLVVGGFDFDTTGSTHPYDHGVRPFVAARRFAATSAELANGSYNLMGLNLRRNNIVQSVMLPSTFGNGVLLVCKSPEPLRVEHCPGAFLGSYSLQVADGVFTGTDASSSDLIHFRVALSGNSKILLRAEDAADLTGRHFRVGLGETDGLGGGSFATSTALGAWGTTNLTDTSYGFGGLASDGTAFSESTTLVSKGELAPTGLRAGTTDKGSLQVVQQGELAVMLDRYGAEGAGTISIGIH